MRFKNKIALVTGAESGIGAKVVQTLLRDGCKVVGTNYLKKNLKNKKYKKKSLFGDELNKKKLLKNLMLMHIMNKLILFLRPYYLKSHKPLHLKIVKVIYWL